MGMNPDTNEFEQLIREQAERDIDDETKLKGLKAEMEGRLIRPDGSPVSEHWSVFTIGEHVIIKNYTFKVAYIGKSSILFEPVGPVMVGEKEDGG